MHKIMQYLETGTVGSNSNHKILLIKWRPLFSKKSNECFAVVNHRISDTVHF